MFIARPQHTTLSRSVRGETGKQSIGKAKNLRSYRASDVGPWTLTPRLLPSGEHVADADSAADGRLPTYAGFRRDK